MTVARIALLALLGTLGLLASSHGASSSAPGSAASEPLIASLDRSIQPLARALLARAWTLAIPLVVTSGLRSSDEQARLYAQGRTTPGPIVTDAPPGASWHEYGLAFDVAPLDTQGRPSWPEDSSLWHRIGALGKALGFTWGGDFPELTDLTHFERHPGLTLADARAGVRPTGGVVT